jgi:hypothetical protein
MLPSYGMGAGRTFPSPHSFRASGQLVGKAKIVFNPTVKILFDCGASQSTRKCRFPFVTTLPPGIAVGDAKVGILALAAARK